MGLRLVAVAFDAHDPVRLATFWSGLLGRAITDLAEGALLAGDDRQVGLLFVPGDGASSSARQRANRLHLHLTSAGLEDQQRTVDTALGLGGRHLDVGQRPEEGHVVLADPEGNEFCVIEPDNAFLAGCGPLGELACDGSRDVGLFWSRVLDWPLVWDEHEETAIQSPRGGTKVAWSGPPVAPKAGRSRQRFELTAVPRGGSIDAELERLVALGATRLGADPDGVALLADPDGNEFRVSSVSSFGPGGAGPTP